MERLGHAQVWWADLDKVRPVVVVTRSPVAPRLRRVLVAPITTVVRGLPTEVPLGPEEGVRAGAGAIHLHPRDPQGRERLDAEIVDEVVIRVREACGVPVGVTTGAWIEPDPERRVELVRAWRAPDYTSVNLSEPGATEVMQA